MPHQDHPSRIPTRHLLDISRRLALGLVAAVALASTIVPAPAEAASCIAPPVVPHAWWKLDSSTFGWTPELMAQNHAIQHGNPQSIAGYVSGAFRLDGDDYLSAEDCQHIDIGTADFSLLAWVRSPVSGDPYGTILSKREFQGTNVVGYQFQLYGGKLLLQIGNATNGHLNFLANTLPYVNDGQWHLVAATVDRDSSTGLRLSIDAGTPQVFDPTGRQGLITTSADLRMGRAFSLGYSDDYFVGDIDEVQIYKHELTQAEIQAIYDAGPSGICPDRLPSLQSCDDGSGN